MTDKSKWTKLRLKLCKIGRVVKNNHNIIQTTDYRYATYEWSADCRGRQFICHVDSEDGVSQQYADLKADACTAVQGQVKADHIYQHEEDAGDEESHYVQQGAPADQHLSERQDRELKSDGY